MFWPTVLVAVLLLGVLNEILHRFYRRRYFFQYFWDCPMPNCEFSIAARNKYPCVALSKVHMSGAHGKDY